MKVFDDKGIQITRLQGYGSDGAAVITGRLTGVETHLKQHSLKPIAVHCANHRLALAAAQAADAIPYLKNYKCILQALFFFYQNSSVQMANVHSIQEILNDPIINANRLKMFIGCHVIMPLFLQF